ncbi:hypothetical protein EDC54_101715 [Samsonia erythrinae]|uniref:Uncharacterized protein n=1 Tax=Samsonia erythrinae TaxID=160434 RepID=A0A4R3VV10_9GAMM|nr:hypothetical protein EDC54_101715 [Samsonia erythrinae]
MAIQLIFNQFKLKYPVASDVIPHLYDEKILPNERRKKSALRRFMQINKISQ